MPELPEVETIRKQLCSAGVSGKTIESVSVFWERTVDPLSVDEFSNQVNGRKIQRVSRHGKWLIFELDSEDNLLVHLRMTGGFYLTQGELQVGEYDRAVFQLSGGLNLHYRDPRKFGRFRLAAFPVGVGPDALEIPARPFFKTLSESKRSLKALLLDQSFIAGVGNIYADEALFAARLHPTRSANSLTDDEKLALYTGITDVLRRSVENGGTSLGDGKGNYVDLNGNSGGFKERAQVYGRAGCSCNACSGTLEKIIVSQRATVFCPRCQS